MLSNGRSLQAVQYKPFHITLSDSFCDRIIKENESLDIIDGTVESKDKNRRSSKISWVPKDKFLIIHQELTKCIDSANKLYNFSLHEFESLQYSRYEEGDHYDWHIDTHSKPYHNGMIRKLSFTLCLNDEYEGGDFEICYPHPILDKTKRGETFKLKKSEMIVFPSNTWHKVNKITKGIRKSLVGWVVGRPFI